MKKCLAKCLKGYDRCCLYCDLSSVCDDTCANTPDKCSMSVNAAEQRREKRTKSTSDKLRRIHLTVIIGVLLIVGLQLIVVGLLNEQAMYQTDILNTINDMRTEPNSLFL